MIAISRAIRTSPVETIKALADQSVPAGLANLTALSINLHAWAQEVSTAPQSVSDLLFVIPGHPQSKMRFRLSSVTECEKETAVPPPTLLERLDTYDPEFFEDKTFFIVLAHTIEGNILQGGQLVKLQDTNHVVQVYVYRASPADPWKAVVCDPNYSREETLRAHKETLRIVGLYVLKAIAWPPLENPTLASVQVKSCLNVNRCVRRVGGGICFTALCATMVAAVLHARQSQKKARNGQELMELILEASHRFRDSAGLLVSLSHLNMPYSVMSRVVAPPRASQRSASPFIKGG